jgi:hypothetical protein
MNRVSFASLIGRLAPTFNYVLPFRTPVSTYFIGGSVFVCEDFDITLGFASSLRQRVRRFKALGAQLIGLS